MESHFIWLLFVNNETYVLTNYLALFLVQGILQTYKNYILFLVVYSRRTVGVKLQTRNHSATSTVLWTVEINYFWFYRKFGQLRCSEKLNRKWTVDACKTTGTGWCSYFTPRYLNKLRRGKENGITYKLYIVHSMHYRQLIHNTKPRKCIKLFLRYLYYTVIWYKYLRSSFVHFIGFMLWVRTHIEL